MWARFERDGVGVGSLLVTVPALCCGAWRRLSRMLVLDIEFVRLPAK